MADKWHCGQRKLLTSRHLGLLASHSAHSGSLVNLNRSAATVSLAGRTITVSAARRAKKHAPKSNSWSIHNHGPDCTTCAIQPRLLIYLPSIGSPRQQAVTNSKRVDIANKAEAEADDEHLRTYDGTTQRTEGSARYGLLHPPETQSVSLLLCSRRCCGSASQPADAILISE